MKNKKAIIEEFGDPSVIKIIAENVPEPRGGEVLVQIEASTVSATDIFIRKGIYPLLKQKPPLTLGYDFVGRIELITENETGLKVGDRVCGFAMTGGNASYICISPQDLTLVPEGINVWKAACLALSGITAYQMFMHYAKVKRGQRILIHGGSGAIGDTLLQLGRCFGCQMVSTASRQKHACIESYGAIAVDYHDDDYEQQLTKLSAEGFDAIFDFTNQRSFNLDIKLLKKHGTLVTYAVYSSSLSIRKKSFLNFLLFGADFGLMLLKLAYWNKFTGKKAVFYGSTDSRQAEPGRHKQDMDELYNLVMTRQLNPLIHQIYPLENVAEAHWALQNGEVQGHVIISSI